MPASFYDLINGRCVTKNKYSKVINHTLLSTPFNYLSMTSAYWTTGHCVCRVSRCTLWYVGPLRGLFSSRDVFMAREDGAHTALWTRRELINVEVLSGRIDGPTFSPLCRSLIDTCSQFEPPSHYADVCRTHAGLCSCCTFLCCVGFALPAWL